MASTGKLGLVVCLALPLLARGGLLLPDLDFKFRNELHSTYISNTSGSTGETRPALTQTFSGRYGLGEWGSVGGYAWTRHQLAGQRDAERRRAFECFEYGLDYAYTWRISDGLSLYSYVDHLWSPSPGWYEHGSTLHAVVIEQALNNRFVAPYYKFCGAYYPHQWETLKLGLRQPFSVLEDDLEITPYGELINGDWRRCEQKYGVEPEQTYCSMCPVATEFGLSFIYKLAKHVSTRLRLRSWNLVGHSVRTHAREDGRPWTKVWIPAATLAVDVKF